MAVCCGVRVCIRVVAVRDGVAVRVAVATTVGLLVGDDVVRFVAVARDVRS